MGSSKLITIQHDVKKPSFPIVAERMRDHIIVLFEGPEEGTVLYSSDTNIKLGYSEDFDPVFDSKIWEILPEVTIIFNSYEQFVQK